MKLIARLIKNSSKKGDSVIDLFGGSGTTLIACEQTGRRCFMSELDPRYTQVIINRYIEFKGSDKDVFRIEKDGSKTPFSEIK